MHKTWVLRLIDELAKPLPGVEAQLRLAPPGRRPETAKTPARESAVLIVLFLQEKEIRTVFIKRAEYEGVHSGQVSLPGGMYKASDKSLEATALRETMEETGLPGDKISIIGNLTALHIPVSKIKVYPFVGLYYEKPIFEPDTFEVKYIIETSLQELLNPINQKFKIMKIGDAEIEIPYFDIMGDHIWGATAMIISEFLEVVKRI